MSNDVTIVVVSFQVATKTIFQVKTHHIWVYALWIIWIAVKQNGIKKYLYPTRTFNVNIVKSKHENVNNYIAYLWAIKLKHKVI